MEIRKIRFRLSGGFAGLVRGTELNGSDLSGAERAALARAVKAAKSETSPEARDVQLYELEVVTDEGTHHLEFDDLHEPAGLGELTARLAQRSRPLAP